MTKGDGHYRDNKEGVDLQALPQAVASWEDFLRNNIDKSDKLSGRNKRFFHFFH